ISLKNMDGMRRLFLFISLVLLFANASFAQNASFDSLRKILRYNKNDTVIARAYIEIARLQERSDPDSSASNYLQAISIVESAVARDSDQSKVNKATEKLLGDAYSKLGALYA